MTLISLDKFYIIRMYFQNYQAKAKLNVLSSSERSNLCLIDKLVVNQLCVVPLNEFISHLGYWNILKFTSHLSDQNFSSKVNEKYIFQIMVFYVLKYIFIKGYWNILKDQSFCIPSVSHCQYIRSHFPFFFLAHGWW